MKQNITKTIKISIILFIILAFAVGNIFCIILHQSITLALCGDGMVFEGEEFEHAQKIGDEMCQEIADEGIVLLKNAGDTLPLSSAVKKVNVFGWSSIDDGFILSGVGSGYGYGGGYSNIQGNKKFSLLKALESQGYECNPELTGVYENYKKARDINYLLVEPETSYYSEQVLKNAKSFSETAIVVISRFGGENIGEIPAYQAKYNQQTDYGRTYLQISAEEENLLSLVGNSFESVIVIINSCNNMHLGFLSDDRVDAALFVGVTGQSGAKSIGKILKGEVSPSGKTTDTYVYDIAFDPAWANRIKDNDSIQYAEDIYFGYKWYETANAEGFFSDVDNQYGENYYGVVQFPFGYGLSYTKFDWEITDINIPSGSYLDVNSKIDITMSVTNTGTKQGKDVIQVYCTPQYYKGGIEKPYVKLVSFAKTVLLEPGKTQYNIKLSFDAYDLAAYDAYDKNNNDSIGYELDKGEYQIKFMKDAHTPVDMNNNIIKYFVDEDIVFNRDPKTNNLVENRLTGPSAYAGVPIDGSNVGAQLQYLSRENFKNTFPALPAKSPDNYALIKQAAEYTNSSFTTYTMPKQGKAGDMRLVTKADGSSASLAALNGNGEQLVFNEPLMLELGGDYYSQQWDDLLDQMTFNDICLLVECSGYRTAAISSIGKPYCRDFDGPSGFNSNIISSGLNTNWTAYPSATLLACSWNTGLAFRWGMSIGIEGSATNVNGWYAPGVNLHRTPYNARNFEYYSEDPLISGKFAAEAIRGAKTNNIYCFIKHLVLSEPGDNPKNVNTWVTESNLRENYLKPFEIAIKEGGANAVMTGYNKIGAVWAGANYPVNHQILREEWGFNGVILTDYTIGDTYMDTEQGIRAGSDLWLNPYDSNPLPLNRRDPTSMTRARIAAKNLLYTYTNTYYFSKTYNWNEDIKYKAVVGVKSIHQVFPWWIPVLIVIDIIILSILSYYIFRVIKPKKM